MGKKTIEDVEVRGKKTLLRVDFNVPRHKETGEIADDERIRAALPTIRYLLDNDAQVIIMSHLGRPKGKFVEDLRLEKVAKHLSTLLNRPVQTIGDSVGDEVDAAILALKDGDVLMLENVRFHPEEEKNDIHFAKRLSAYTDLFVNDAFGTAHRAHCSTEGVGHYLPSVAGYLIKNEISALANAVIRPIRPYVSIVGGAKISDKIGVIESLVNKADVIVIGGGMANTFLAAQGYDMKASLVEQDSLEKAGDILAKVKAEGKQLLLPEDVVVSYGLDDNVNVRTIAVDALQDGEMALDIGPKTCARYQAAIEQAKTVFWNGPMGVFENPQFAQGTMAVAQAVADCPGYTIIGGGDSVAAIHQAGLANKIDHISTGGGASLAFIEGRILPGLAVIDEKEEIEK